jgi:hypothetical protein
VTRAVPSLLLLVATAAWAGRPPPAVAGDYPVAVKEISTTCTTGGISMEKGTLTIEQKGRATYVKVMLPPTSIMRGSIDAAGKVKARAKRGGTAIQGLQGEYSVAGTADGKSVDMVLAAQYFTGGQPYCQQSWTVKGQRP